MAHRLWLPAVASPISSSLFRTAHPYAQSVKGSQTEPVLSRSSRKRLGHLQSNFDGRLARLAGTLFPEPQAAASCRRVERRDCVRADLPRLQYASRWFVIEQLVPGSCRVSCAFHAAGNSPPNVRRGDSGQ